MEHQIKKDYVKQKLIYFENRSKRYNLRVDSILENPGKDCEDCEKKLQQVFQEKLGLEYRIEIERTHQTSIR